MYSKVLLSCPISGGGRTQWNLGKVVVILSVIPSVFVLLNGHLVFYEDRKQTLEEPWGKIDSVI